MFTLLVIVSYLFFIHMNYYNSNIAFYYTFSNYYTIIKEAKYLGVMVDQYLNWIEQITAIKKKVSRGIGMLKYS